jgi:hypothetical protein
VINVKKLKFYSIPVVLMLLFVCIMTTGSILKKPFSQKDDVQYYLKELKKVISSERWDQASYNLDKLKYAWEIVEKRIQFSVERGEMISIDRNIARISGAIDAKDKTSGLIEISEIKENWDKLEE